MSPYDWAVRLTHLIPEARTTGFVPHGQLPIAWSSPATNDQCDHETRHTEYVVISANDPASPVVTYQGVELYQHRNENLGPSSPSFLIAIKIWIGHLYFHLETKGSCGYIFFLFDAYNFISYFTQMLSRRPLQPHNVRKWPICLFATLPTVSLALALSHMVLLVISIRLGRSGDSSSIDFELHHVAFSEITYSMPMPSGYRTGPNWKTNSNSRICCYFTFWFASGLWFDVCV